MNLQVKAVCKTAKIKKDNTSTIAIQYCFTSEKRALLDSGLSIPPKYWIEKKGRVSDALPELFGNAIELNHQLQQELKYADDIISLAKRRKENPLEFFKNYYKPGQRIDHVLHDLATKDKSDILNDVYRNKDIYFQIDQYIKVKTKKVSPDMPRIYRNMKDHLLAFEQFRKRAITFDTLGFDFYEELVDFLTYDYVHRRRRDDVIGLKTNTVGKTINQLKTFLKDRIKKGIIPSFDMEDWIVFRVDVDAVYLSIKEINAIKNVNLVNHPHLVDYRNDLILGCLTGLRFSDFSKIKQHDLRDGMLFKKQQKSDHWVVIPLRTDALKILECRSFENFKPPTNPEFNRHIKNLARLAGITEPITHSFKKGNKLITETRSKCDWITSHTCRRSFCTNEFLAGTPVSLIMKISGHKSEKDFYKYIRISPEEAAYKIKDIWKERGELQ
ncbi:phage integrase SAM-like domain-containing protein [Ferruginibacter paludis]|uniref:phage integrase SAM-like domain-containing protein n=1 Tax=Ferruginibacter paludis TaxID=1310417 RepID=UPI0025B3C002|nr:phage integrase SAM-like domain-containing protein [Ferruginibacter paludis]MDN3655119.1 phage integrase SAM-like domain-containing protein [Ferruginibacter paludis]